MNITRPFRPWTVFAAGLAAGAVAVAAWTHWVPAAHAQAAAPPAAGGEIAALRADVERLKQIVPDQAHAMSDVAWHYSNLWFAGQHENWDLAQFMFNEARSHMRWAVRIIPVRKDNAGRDVDVGAILQAVEGSALKDLEGTIHAKDKQKFEAAYKLVLTNCAACHQAVSKPYIRTQVPQRPDSDLINFAPADDRNEARQ
jgi:hypothetical protein